MRRKHHIIYDVNVDFIIMDDMNGFKEEASVIVSSILKYKEKYGNDDTIKEYYQTHGTFNGIVEYLESLQASK